MSKRSTLAWVCTVLALLFSLMSFSGWIPFVVGFANARSSIQAAGNFTLIEYSWDVSYYVVSIASPILFLLMMIMGIWLLVCFCCEVRRKYYTIIHILAVLAFLLTMLVLCFAGDILGHTRILIQTGSQVILNQSGHGGTIPEKAIHAMFAGALVEVICLGGTWIFFILTHACVEFGQD